MIVTDEEGVPQWEHSPEDGKRECKVCGGEGLVTVVHEDSDISWDEPCPHCRGAR
jgi:DnaJ-class molecular chaperone